jgi:hypothetical protein
VPVAADLPSHPLCAPLRLKENILHGRLGKEKPAGVKPAGSSFLVRMHPKIRRFEAIVADGATTTAGAGDAIAAIVNHAPESRGRLSWPSLSFIQSVADSREIITHRAIGAAAIRQARGQLSGLHQARVNPHWLRALMSPRPSSVRTPPLSTLHSSLGQGLTPAQAVKNSLTVVPHDSLVIERNSDRKDQPCQTWKRQFANGSVIKASSGTSIHLFSRRTR